MERIDVDDAEPGAVGREIDCRRVSESVGATDVAINRYVLGRGEALPGGLHAHLDQEEIFLVCEGAVTFETYLSDGETPGARTTGEVTVEDGEAIRFAPGDFQSGRNDADDAAVILAIGAPRDSEDVRVPLPCPECGHGDTSPAVAEDGDASVLRCPACGTESGAACPECDREAMRATIPADGTEPVGVCRACGAETETA